MSYLDPPGGHTSSDDWSSADGGRDEHARARHDGAAPDPYAAFRRDAGAPAGWSGSADAPDVPAGWSGPADAPEPPAGQPVAYPLERPPPDAPAWEAPTAATSTSQAEFDARRGPGRRRRSRSGGTAATPPNGAPPAARSKGAGRNLGAAIAVGLSLGAVIIASLFIYPPAFVGVIVVAASVGTWEMVRALRSRGAAPALIPLLAGGVLMIGLTRYAGTDALLLGLVVTVAAAMLWRVGDGTANLRRDVTATVLVAVYVPFLLSFAMLLAAPEADGGIRVVATVLAVVLSDTGGYASGVFLGKHAMAPTISPNKSWEGFAGSVLAAAAGSAVVLFVGLDVTPWKGAVFGVVISVVAVLGDLTESMMKRDLDIKDMSQLLPGHGGLMDRLDSILFAVPTAYLVLSLIAPPG